MTKEGIIELIRREVSAGTLTVDDVLVEMNRVVVENIKTAIEKSQGKISFIENKPRLISCCFSQVLELDVNEVWYNNGLHFSCEEPETHEIYQLESEDFLFGELRHLQEACEILNYKTYIGNARTMNRTESDSVMLF